MAGNTLGRAVVDFGANTATLQTDMSRAVGIVDKAVADINVTINKAGSGANFNGVSSQVKSLESDFQRLQGVISTVFGVGIGVAAIKQVADLADEYQNVSNRIRTTVADTQQLAAVQQQVFQIAQQTGATLEDTAKMYQRLEQSIQGSGKSQADAQQQAIALTKTLNEEIIVSGASAGEASRAIMDLVHGLSGGVLHAQQLRPIMRQMPDLARQIADGLGLSAKQFEELVHQGLPAADVLKALAAQSGAIEDRFNALPKTFARVWTELKNAVEQYIGQASQAGTLSDSIKNGISGLANNIDAVAKAAEVAGVAMAAWLGGSALRGLSAMTTGIYQAVTATGAYKTAAILAAEADIQVAAAQQAALASTIARTDALNDLRITEINSIQAKSVALTQEIAQLETEAVAGNNVMASTERLIAARQELAVATAREAELEGAMASAQAKATLAENEETAATIRLAEAKVALGAAQAEATAATGLFARAASGVFAAIGGWPTVILAAAAGVYYLVTAEDDLDKKNDELAKTLDQVTAAHGNLSPAMEKTAQAALAEAQAVEANIAAQLKVAQSEQDASVGAYDMGGGFIDAEAKSSILSAQLEKAHGIVDGLTNSMRFLGVQAGVTGNALALSMDGIRGALQTIESLGDGLAKTTAQMELQAATFHKGHAAVLEYQRDQELAKVSAGATADQISVLKHALDEQYGPAIKAAQALDAVTEAGKKHADQSKKNANAAIQADQALKAQADLVDTLAEKIGTDLAGVAYAKYQKAVRDANADATKSLAAGNNIAQVMDLQTQAIANAAQAYNDYIDKLAEESDSYGIVQKDLNEQLRLLSLSTDARKAEEIVMKEVNDQKKIGHDLSADEIDDLNKLATGYVEQAKNIEAAKKVQEEYLKQTQKMWGDVADAVFDAATKSGNFLKNLLANLKSIVTQMLKEWFRTSVIGYFTGTGGGGGGSIISSGLGLLTSSGGSGGSAVINAGSQAGNVTGGSGTDLFSTAGWVDKGKALWNGFMGPSGASSGSTIFGSYSGAFGGIEYAPSAGGSQLGLVPDYANGGAGMGVSVGEGSYTYTPSALGYTTAIAAGVYAGFSRWQGSNKDFGGAVGGVAYGVGTTYAAIGAGAALSGGAAAGMAAIPVVGWIALAAMAVDMLSGGKLFGTGKQMKGGWSSMTTGPDGAFGSTDLDMKGQSAFFGGATFSQKHMDGTPEQNAAAQAFYDAIKKSSDDFAKTFGSAAGVVAAGSFSQKFDKKGNLTGETITHIDGQTYNNETAEQFGERIQAESFTADLKAIGLDITAYTHQFINDADAYAAAVKDAATVANAAQIDIANGVHFLALGTDQSIQAIYKLAEANIQGSETIAQAFQRIEQAQVAYTQFVSQFQPGATYASQFQAALAGINDKMKADAAQANALARAAGAEHAATQDLINIHNAAAQAFVAAVQELQNESQSLAVSLGYAMPTNLNDINAQIQALEAKAGDSTSALDSFGSSITNVSQRATDAINLLLGDLSPLNDQQKLQTALQGQLAGTVTPTQVLEIARRLMGTGSDYARIFAQVQAVGDRTNQNQGDAGGSPASGGGLSYADQQQLKELRRRQAEAEQTERHNSAVQLAQNIADLVSSTGESIPDALKNLGITDITQFMKDLGVTDEKAFDAMIEKMETTRDSADESTSDLAHEISTGNSILLDILDALGGHSNHGSPSPNGSSGSASNPVITTPVRGTRGHSGDLVLRGGRP